MRSASLGKKILCIFMVDFSIDPRAQTLGPPLKEVDFPLEQLHLTGLERVKRFRPVRHLDRGGVSRCIASPHPTAGLSP